VSAADVVGTVADPELPMLTLGDLGIVRDVRDDDEGVVVTITPTYSGCPAMETIREDIVEALRSAGFARAQVRTVLAPAWSSDWISEAGRAKLERMRPVAERHGLTPLQLACQWNLSHQAVECVAPTLIQEAGPGAKPIERKREELAAVAADAPMMTVAASTVAALNDLVKFRNKTVPS